MPKKFDFYCQEALSGKTPIDKLYESEQILAFYHTQPSYPVHIVIIPKKCILDLPSIQDKDLPIFHELFRVARNLSQKLDKTQGIRLITNTGKFQDTPHIHFHLISGDKF